MTIQPISKSFFGVSENDDFFNLEEATRVYRQIMSMSPDERDVVLSAVLLDNVPKDLEENAEQIQEFTQRYVAKRLEIIRPSLVRSLITHRDNPEMVENISKAVEYLDVISKTNSYKRQYKRGGNPKNTGQFSENWGPPRRIHYGSRTEPSAREIAAMPDHSVLTRPEDAAQYRDAYIEVQEMLGDLGNLPPKTKLTLKLSNGSEKEVDPSPDSLDPAWFSGPGNNVTSVEIKGKKTSLNDESYDPWKVLTEDFKGFGGAKGFKNQGGEQFFTSGDMMQEFGNTWNNSYDEDSITPSTRVYRRIGTAAALAGAIGGNNSAVTAAALAGKWVGDYGSDAEKVFGPSARRAAYRYRGVEKTPDEILQRSIAQAIQAERGDTTAARNKIVYGSRMAPQKYSEIDAERNGEIVESKVIEYFINRLPRPDISALHLNAGFTPPSEGVVIDSKGQVVTQAVGYGDDHFLPFNLKNLKKLKGGEYIRTRATGGLTTEDIRTGLMTGARSITVISRNGIYTMEFDDTFRGGRRYSDKAARMTSRYGRILDAVQSRQVAEDVPPDLKDEWEEHAFRRKMSPEQTKAYIDQEEKRWRQRPYMSATEKEKVAGVYLDAVQERIKTGTGEPISVDLLRSQVEAQLANKPARDLLIAQERWDQQAAEIEQYGDPAAQLGPRPDESILRAQLAEITSSVSTDAGLVEALDKTTFRRTDGKSHKDAFAATVKTAEKEYMKRNSPLRLNGEGYHKALRTLQEQFPYYIKSIEYRPLKDAELGRAGASDKGYVKPRFNRPAAAQFGYFDPTITGSGKTNADRTNYQNYRALERGLAQQVKAEEKAKAEAGVGGGVGKAPAVQPGGTPSPTTGSPGSPWTDADAREAAWKAYEDLTINAVANGYQIGTPDGNKFSFSDVDHNELSKEYPFLWGSKLRTNTGPLAYDEFMSLLDERGSEAWAALSSEINKVSTGKYKYFNSGNEPLTRANNRLLDMFGSSGRVVRAEWTPESARRPNTEFNFVGMAYERDAEPEWIQEELNLQFEQLPDTLRAAMKYTPERAVEIGLSPTMQTKIRDLSVAYTETKELGKKAEIAVVLENLSRIRQLARNAKRTGDREKRVTSIDSWNETTKPAEGAKPEPPKAGETSPVAPTAPTGEAKPTTKPEQPKINPVKVQELVTNLDNMVGMDSVSNEVDGLVASALNNAARQKVGLPVEPKTMHLVFTGSPGTGKTTVAEIIAPLYKELGLTENSHIVKATPKDLIAPYLGQTRIKTAEVFDRARGGVLFIDEAYGLGDSQYGSEAIDELLTKMEQHRDDTVVIVAGYPKEMTHMLKVNPGLASRFSKTIHFPNYSASDLQTIFNRMMAKGKYIPNETGMNLVHEVVRGISQDTNSANGRDVRNLYDAIRTAQSKRLRTKINPTQKELVTVTDQDIKNGISAYYGRKL